MEKKQKTKAVPVKREKEGLNLFLNFNFLNFLGWVYITS